MPSVDPRPWLRLDQGFPENQKVAPISDGAFRLYIEGLCYAKRAKTDGSIPAAIAHRMKPKRAATELVKAGLWEDAGDAYLIHDYLHHQESVEEQDRNVAERRKDGVYGAHVRHHVKTGKPSTKCRHCVEEGLLRPRIA